MSNKSLIYSKINKLSNKISKLPSIQSNLSLNLRFHPQIIITTSNLNSIYTYLTITIHPIRITYSLNQSLSQKW
jgi:hypothetical protein